MATVASISSHSHTPSVERPRVIVPVAGAFNAELGPFSTGQAHNSSLRKLFEDARMPVAHTITPSHFGIVGSVESEYERFAEKVDTALARYGSNALPVYVAHSFGGLLALRDHAVRDSGGVLTLGSPHGRMRHAPVIGRLLQHVEPYHHRCAEFEEFSQETLDRMEQQKYAGEVIFAGSTIDPVVGVHASTPAVSGVRRVLFGPDLGFNIPASHRTVPRIPGLVEHIRLLTDHTVGAFVLSHVAEMVDPLVHEPIPNNVYHLPLSSPAS